MPFYLDQIENLADKYLDQIATLFYNEKTKELAELFSLQLFEKAFLLSAYFIEEAIEDCPIAIIDFKNQASLTVMLGALYSGNSFYYLSPNLPTDQLFSKLSSFKTKFIWLPEHLIDLKRLIQEKFPNLVFISLIENKSASPNRRLSIEQLGNKRATIIGENEGISHNELNIKIKRLSSKINLNTSDRTLSISALTTEHTISEFLWSLSSGVTICCVNPHQFFLVPEIINLSKATVWATTPSIAKTLLEARPYAAEYFGSLKYIVFGQEILDESLIESWMKVIPKVKILDLYNSENR